MSRRILIAGIGNVFFGDDGFGVDVARRLAQLSWPPEVRLLDVGIRGLHLAFELLEPVDLLVLIDATPRGNSPGTLYVIEPETSDDTGAADAHSLSIPSVFAQVRAMGGVLPPIRIVGCEPLETAEGLGLSPVVEQAAGQAVALVRELVDVELSRAEPGPQLEATHEMASWEAEART